MSFFQRLRKSYKDYMYEHERQKDALSITSKVIIISISAFLFALGFKCFLVPQAVIHPVVEYESYKGIRLVSGGVSGFSQTIIMAGSLFPNSILHNNGSAETVFYSCLYFGLNIPIVLLAFFGIGKRFAFYTVLNVAEVSLWTYILSFWDYGWVGNLAFFASANGGMLSRAFFAGIFTGISSALAFKVDGSAGGIDVIAYFIALKKSKLVGKYNFAINGLIVALFTVFGTLKLLNGLEEPIRGEFGNVQYLAGVLFSVVYMFVTSLIIDFINVRNKKLQIEVVTDKEDLHHILMGSIPHGATIEKGYGAFTNKEKTIIQIVISSFEEKETIRIIRAADPKAFIKVVDLRQVYGRFYVPKIK